MIFREHFRKSLDATSVSFEGLVLASRDRGSHGSCEGIVQGDLLELIPPISVVSAECRAVKQGRAYGEDLQASALFKKHATSMAEVIQSCRVKSVMSLQPPIQFRGGMLCELFKQKGCSSLCINYRDIMLAMSTGRISCA